MLPHLTANDLPPLLSRSGNYSWSCPSCAKPGFRWVGTKDGKLILLCPDPKDPCSFVAMIRELLLRATVESAGAA